MDRQMSEKILQYYWLSMVRRGHRLRLTDGREAEIVSPGIFNRDSGPDFSYARLRIGQRTWAGNIEMHLRATDWYRHRHHHDEAYAGVVLHVVTHSDAEISLPDGSTLAQTVMTVPDTFASAAETLFAEGEPYMRCASIDGFLPALEPVRVSDWIETLLAARVNEMTDRLLALHRRLGGDWRQTAFATLARALGFGINAEPMEMLAASVPLNFLERHSSSLFQLEAMLFGQAGMLPGGEYLFDTYYNELAREWAFLSHKYSLHPFSRSIWRLACTRPANFPYRRIALLAAFCRGGFSFLGDVMEAASSPDRIDAVLMRTTSSYWHTHYSFNSDSVSGVQNMSAASRAMLCINAVIPLLTAYARHESRPLLADMAETMLNRLRPEATALARRWREAGIPVRNAADSQALHYLYKTYCSQNRCGECRWGARLMHLRARQSQPE